MGSASTMLGEKAASFSKNAVLGFRLFPARFRELALTSHQWEERHTEFLRNGGGRFLEHQVKIREGSQGNRSRLSHCFQTLYSLRHSPFWGPQLPDAKLRFPTACRLPLHLFKLVCLKLAWTLLSHRSPAVLSLPMPPAPRFTRDPCIFYFPFLSEA